MEKGTLFVTGGSNGIGKAVIDNLGKKYKKAVSFDISGSKNDDVRNPQQLEQAFDEELSKNQYQNDLVVCAGVFRPIDFLQQSQEDIDFVLDINLKGALYTVQKFLNWHEKNKHLVRPNIIIISSISAFYHGGRKNVVYDGTKAALSYIVKDLANFNCVINALEPGTIRNTKIGGWSTDFSEDKTARELIEKGQQGDVEGMGWEVTTQDIAHVIKLLLFDNMNGVINGTTITVDGGLTVLKQRF